LKSYDIRITPIIAADYTDILFRLINNPKHKLYKINNTHIYKLVETIRKNQCSVHSVFLKTAAICIKINNIEYFVMGTQYPSTVRIYSTHPVNLKEIQFALENYVLEKS